MKKAQSPSINKNELVNVYRQAILSGVSLDKLEDKIETFVQRTQVTEQVEHHAEQTRSQSLKNRVPRIIRVGAAFLPLVMVGMGLFLVSTALLPIVSYYLWELPQLQASTLTSPLPPEQTLDIMPMVIAQGADENASMGQILDETKPLIIDAELDYTNLSNWFGIAELTELSKNGTVEQKYTVDIPSINVQNAEVAVGGTNLNKSLIQYPGTALPGSPGSPVIFGHSVLRQFYNPNEKNPRRYNSIFSTIMTLKKGDEIFVTMDGVKYTYKVQEKTEVKPQDVYILAQRYDSRQLKLVTCTPEGTYLRRGVVTAVLVPTQ